VTVDNVSWNFEATLPNWVKSSFSSPNHLLKVPSHPTMFLGGGIILLILA
jgi:hypothetical protein